jgi:hypothetical protein
MSWVESICKSYKPDVVLLDMGDKFAKTGGFARTDEALKANAVHARMIAKQHECAVFYMSQLSADAEGKVLLNQSMMEGSRTGKAAEADLMVLIAKNPVVDGQDEEDTQRHLNVVKNKQVDTGSDSIHGMCGTLRTKNSIHGAGTAGFLGEQIALKVLGGQWQNTYDYDIVDATFMKKGDVDPSNNFTVRADCYNLRIDKLGDAI